MSLDGKSTYWDVTDIRFYFNFLNKMLQFIYQLFISSKNSLNSIK